MGCGRRKTAPSLLSSRPQPLQAVAKAWSVSFPALVSPSATKISIAVTIGSVVLYVLIYTLGPLVVAVCHRMFRRFEEAFAARIGESAARLVRCSEEGAPALPAPKPASSRTSLSPVFPPPFAFRVQPHLLLFVHQPRVPAQLPVLFQRHALPEALQRAARHALAGAPVTPPRPGSGAAVPLLCGSFPRGAAGCRRLLERGTPWPAGRRRLWRRRDPLA